MKKITHYRWGNRYCIVSSLLLLSILFISWCFFSTFLEVLTLDYSAPDLVDSNKYEVMRMMLNGVLSWENFIDSSMRYVIYIFPIFALLPIVAFHGEKKLYLQQGYHRFKNYRLEVIKTILHYSLIGGLVIALTFVAYFTLASFFMTASIENIGGYASIFPSDFYSNYPYLFFVFMAMTIYFAIGFTFALLGCGISMLVDNKYLIVAIPLSLYLLDAYILGGLGVVNFQIFMSVCSFNTLLTTVESFIPLIPFITLAIIVNFIGIRKNQRLMEW